MRKRNNLVIAVVIPLGGEADSTLVDRGDNGLVALQVLSDGNTVERVDDRVGLLKHLVAVHEVVRLVPALSASLSDTDRRVPTETRHTTLLEQKRDRVVDECLHVGISIVWSRTPLCHSVFVLVKVDTCKDQAP